MNARRTTAIALVVLSVVTSVAPLRAAFHEEYFPAVVEARGGSGIATARETDAAYYNPAALCNSQEYVVDIGVASTLDGGEYPLNVAVFDAITNRWLCTHVGFTFLNTNSTWASYDKTTDTTTLKTRQQRTFAWRSGVGIPAIKDHLALGMGLKYFLSDPSRGSSVHRVGFDLGVVASPVPQVKLGFTALNVASKDLNAFGRAVGFGLGLDFSFITIEGDYILYYRQPGGKNEKAHAANGGATANIGGFYISGGYEWTQIGSQQSIGAGIGYRSSSTVEVALSYWHQLTADESYTPATEEGRGRLMFSLRIFVTGALRQSPY